MFSFGGGGRGRRLTTLTRQPTLTDNRLTIPAFLLLVQSGRICLNEFHTGDWIWSSVCLGTLVGGESPASRGA